MFLATGYDRSFGTAGATCSSATAAETVVLLEVEKAEDTVSCGAHMVDGLSLMLGSVGEPKEDW